jgi:hypothetical protein
MWWVPVGSNRLGPGCLVLCADTRENPGGKNRVMTKIIISCKIYVISYFFLFFFS